jgi:hypothetical protein
MFRVKQSPIIRSSIKLYLQHLVLINRCGRPSSWMSRNFFLELIHDARNDEYKICLIIMYLFSITAIKQSLWLNSIPRRCTRGFNLEFHTFLTPVLRWVFTFTHRLLPCRWEVLCVHWIAGCLHHSGGLSIVAKVKSISSILIELQSPNQRLVTLQFKISHATLSKIRTVAF